MGSCMSSVEKAVSLETDAKGNYIRDEARIARGKRFNRTALLIFLVVQAGYLIFGGYSIVMMVTGWEKVTDFNDDGNVQGLGARAEIPAFELEGGKLPPVDAEARGMYFMATGTCVVVNVVMLLTMRWMAGIYVWLGPILLVLYLAAGAGLAAWKGATFIALCWGAFVPLVLFLLYLMRRRFILGKYMLSTAAHIAMESGNVYGLVFVSLIVQFFLGLLNIFAMIGCFLVFQPDHEGCSTQTMPCSWAITIVGCFFLLLAHLWLSAFIGNLFLMALAGGPFSRYYFDYGDKAHKGSFWALRRAFKTSLGSVAFGTMFVGAVHFFNGLIGVIARSDAEGVVGLIVKILAMIIYPLTRMLDGLLKLFNKYAYIFIAIGKKNPDGSICVDDFDQTFWEAGLHCAEFVLRRPKHKKGKRDPQALIQELGRNHGISAIVNDDITGTALGMACLSTAFLCSIVTFLYMYFVNDRVISDHWYDWMAVFYAFVLGLTIGLVATSALEVGVSTLFVCMSEDIRKLETLNPEFHCWVQWKYSGMFVHLFDKAQNAEGDSHGGQSVEEREQKMREAAKKRFKDEYQTRPDKDDSKSEKDGKNKARWNEQAGNNWWDSQQDRNSRD